jgi:hypothetical protein
MNYSNLPQEVQAEIKANLSCYNKCTVEKTESGYDVYNGAGMHNGAYGETIQVSKQEVYTYAEWCAAFELENGYKPSTLMHPSW